MAKSVLLHIGANKTGSTAIQDFLLLNASALRDLGFVVAPADLLPGGQITGRHVRLFKLMLADIEHNRPEIERRLRSLVATLEPDQRLIISAENLALSSHDRPGGAGDLNRAQELFANLAPETELRVLLYIRRQDEFLLSSWQQWESKMTADFWAWMLTAAGREGDWRAVLSAWDKVVPRDNIQVRLYDRRSFPGDDIIADFAAALGIDTHLATLKRPRSDSNPGHAEVVTAFAGANPLIYPTPHDHRFQRALQELTGNRYRRKPRESRITHAQRCAILARYDDSNEWVRRTYFPEQSAPLFPPPLPEDYDEPALTDADVERWQLTASLIYGLAQRLKP